MRNLRGFKRWIAGFGILCGAYNLLLGVLFSYVFALFGIALVVINFSLLKKVKWSEIAATITSICVLVIYGLIILNWIRSGYHYSWGVAMILHSLTIFWSIGQLISAMMKAGI